MRTNKCVTYNLDLREKNDRYFLLYAILFQELDNASCILAHVILINNSMRYIFLPLFTEKVTSAQRS